MAVVYVDDTVGYSRDTGDFYILAPWSKGQPWAVDHWGLMDYLLQTGVLGPDERLTDLPSVDLIESGVKFGRSVRSDEWRQTIRWIDSDPELPRKSARYHHERP